MNIDALIENFYKKTENDNLVDEVMKFLLQMYVRIILKIFRIKK